MLVEDEGDAEVIKRVPAGFIDELELEVSRLQLDWTHIFSDMVIFGPARASGGFPPLKCVRTPISESSAQMWPEGIHLTWFLDTTHAGTTIRLRTDRDCAGIFRREEGMCRMPCVSCGTDAGLPTWVSCLPQKG